MAKILVVDDSKTERMACAEALRAMGHVVSELENGDRIEEVLAQAPPDLIVLDVVMPNQNGFQLCRKLKKETKTKAIPIIILSSKSGEADKAWGMRQGASAYLTKPVNPAELKSAIAALGL